MSADLITIGITSYNAEDSIAQAINSAFEQSWDNTEIVIVDDCSNDNTWNFLQKISKENPTIRVFQNEQNSGVAVSRNRIIHEAKGTFVVFFDDDDISSPERLQEQYERIISYEAQYANGAPVICHTSRIQNYPNGESRIEHTMGTNKNGMVPNGKDVATRILTGKPVADVYGSVATCSQMARTQTYKNLGGFDENFKRSEDTDFCVRLALAGGHFAGLAEPLVSQNMTLTSDKNIDDEELFTMQLLNKHKDFINAVSSYTACKNWITAKYTLLKGDKTAFILKIFLLFLRYPVFVLKRIYWALPSVDTNKSFSGFYNGSRT